MALLPEPAKKSQKSESSSKASASGSVSAAAGRRLSTNKRSSSGSTASRKGSASGMRSVNGNSGCSSPASSGASSYHGEACSCKCASCPAGNQLDSLPLPYLTFSSSLKLVYANAHARTLFPAIPPNATAAHFFSRPVTASSPVSDNPDNQDTTETTASAAPSQDTLAVLRAQLIGIADEQAARSGWGGAALLNHFINGQPHRSMVAVKYFNNMTRLDPSAPIEKRSKLATTTSPPPSPKAHSSNISTSSSNPMKRPRSPPQHTGVAFSVLFLNMLPEAESSFSERAKYFLDRPSTFSRLSFNSQGTTPVTSPSEVGEQGLPQPKNPTRASLVPESPIVASPSPDSVNKIDSETRSPVGTPLANDSKESQKLAALLDKLEGDKASHLSISKVLSVEEIGRAIDDFPQIIWLADPSGQIVYLNKTWYSFTGVSLAELQDPAKWLDLFHPDDLAEALETYGAACANHESYTMQYRVKNRDGNWRWMFATGKPLFNAEGKPYLSVAVLSDVEELVNIRSEAIRMRKHVSAVLAGSELFFMTVDTNQIITLLEGPSPTGSWQSGKGHLLIGKPLQEVIQNRTLSDAINKMLAENLDSLVLRTGPDVEDDEVSAPTQSKSRHIRYRLVPLRENDVTQGVIIVGSDVSRVVEAEEALERSSAERVTLEASARAAREASRLKTAFTTTMSHEIRSPIAGMMGVFELLLADTRLPSSARALVEKGLMTGELLLDIVGRVLDFGKIEAGKLEIESKPFKLSELVADTSVFSMQAEKRGLVYKQDVGSFFDGFVKGDRIRVRQVLFNGLSNSIKFTKQGNITLKVKQEAESAYEVLVHFEITDTGLGIDKAALGNLFKPFTQADSSTARRFGGSGLGLAISRDLVKLMGGTINISSVPGKGTTLSVHLPFEKEKEQNVPHAKGGVLPNPPKSPVTATHREAWPMDKVTTSSVVTPPAVAAVMGESTGYMDSLYTSPGSASSAQASISVSSPTRPNLVSRPSSSILLPRVSHQQMFAPKKRPEEVTILVAEDNELLRDIVSRTLEKMHFKVDSVENGEQAVTAAKTGRYSLILMDGQMPEKSGYAATAEIRRCQDPVVSSVKIIALTASAVKGDRERCLEAGMDSYLSKPVRAKDLEAAIWSQLGLEGTPPLSSTT